MAVISGINPCIFLHSEEGMTFALSYWQIDISPLGPGACVFYADLRINRHHTCLTDNPDLANFLHVNFNRHFDGFNGLEIPKPLQTMQQTDRMSFHDGGAKLSIGQVEAIWHGAKAPSQIIDNLDGFGENGNQRYSVSAVIVPCESASVSLEGKRVPGFVASHYGKLDSSAFLAVGESWSPV